LGGIFIQKVIKGHIKKNKNKYESREYKKMYLYLVCLTENGFLKIIFLCLFVVRKVGQRKTLFKQRKIGLGFQESVFFYFGWKTLFENYEKFKNIILFADYIKFGPQTFDCYIYFVLNICFSISSLRI